jgi:ectoine hydroxylase-related dioxygenase (phytanoyl-CoA dioxygenase family)
MTKGDIVVFHGLAPHRSGPNKTNSLRRLVLITYGNSDYYGENYYDTFFEEKIKRQPPVHMWDPSVTYVKNEFGKWIPE